MTLDEPLNRALMESVEEKGIILLGAMATKQEKNGGLDLSLGT